MTDDRNEIRHINWGELFSFTHVFKSFKLAIHPSKIVLAVAAIVLIWAIGNGLDYIWCWAGHDVRPGEVQEYVSSPVTFKSWMEDWGDAGRLETAGRKFDDVKFQIKNLNVNNILHLQIGSALLAATEDAMKTHVGQLPQDEQVPTKLSELLGKIRKGQSAMADAILDSIEQGQSALEKTIANDKDKKEQQEQKEQLKKDYVVARTNLATWKKNNNTDLSQIQGVGVFDSFAAFEWNRLSNAITAVGNGNFLGGWLTPAAMQEPTFDPFTGNAVQARSGLDVPAPASAPGFVYYVIQAVGGLKWLLTQHLLFGAIFLVLSLAVWALFGGAIHRMSALHAAREEKISIVQALAFALGKWPSFFTAPLIPLGVVFVLGGLVVFGGFVLGNWPYVGAPLVGIFFFLALALGVAIAFVLIGLVSGLGLMYPTIAVEGSDSFDAFSRSFAYVYGRPWHAGLYALTALVYGAVCYLFVRLFAFLALSATYMFMRWGVWTGGEALNETDKIPVIWRKPTWDSLYGNFNWDAMSGGETIGAVFIWLWVALVAAVVGAFLLSYVSSSSTIIYYLLRRKVDATDLDDVYVPESPEMAAETAVAGAETAPAPTAEPQAPSAADNTPPAGDAPATNT